MCLWQGSKPCSAASKSFLLSAGHQLIRAMLGLSFLALPKFIFSELLWFIFKLSPVLAFGTWWEQL